GTGGITWSGTVRLAGEVTIAAGLNVTIDAGTAIKADTGAGLTVSGTLDARGTSLVPVTFTSVRDQSAGADLVGGPGVPQRGDWRGLTFTASSGASVLNNVQIHYAGNSVGPGNSAGTTPGLTLQGSALQLSNVQVVDADGAGVAIASGSPVLDTVIVNHARG